MSAPARTVGVTGAAGFIGRRLVERFGARGWAVRAFQRSAAGPDSAEVSYRAFRLPDRVREEDVAGLDALVHAAVQIWGPGHTDADAVNLEGTRRVIAAARRHGVRLVFLSTLSAHPEAVSHYGRNKLEVEALFDPARDAILRLGLVLDRRGGLFGGMVETLRGSRIVPLVDGGRQPIQTLAMDDLLTLIERVIANGIAGRFDVATPRVYRMRDLYDAILRASPRRPWLVPVPLGAVLFGATLLERLRIPSPVTRENVLGLRCLKAFDTAPDLARLGVTLEPLESCAARLLAEP
ncbi:MAG TPA: NAD-dependent epimerase/dehydratase family protein [Candidatus Eisenbacteria bacterium]|jgi:NADH dehydrogenase